MQQTKDHYYTADYLTHERMASYCAQFDEIMKRHPNAVLEIGIGNGILVNLLKKCNIATVTMDIDSQLSPDVIGSIASIPFTDGSYDLVACFEVLEHLPFEQISFSLREISRITRRWAIISLPDRGRCYGIEFKLPRFKKKLLLSLPYILGRRKYVFNGDHYWEIGDKTLHWKKSSN